MSSSELSAESIKAADALVIVTNHRTVDYEMIVRNAKLIVDTRNATAPFRHLNDNILRA